MIKEVDLKSWSYQCGDRCCDDYGTSLIIDGERVDEIFPDEFDALLYIIEKAGIKLGRTYDSNY